METQQNKASPALQNLRQEIDAVDEQIISLLQKRMAIVGQVAAVKKNNQENFFIKSAREADMIKNLIKKSGDNFPKATIVSLWRKIIAASNMHEQKISIALHNPKNIPDLFYLVKEYYNESVPLHNFDSTAGVVSELESKKAQIGVFVLPAHEQDDKNLDNNENWWIRLANNRLGLKVFAMIPFVEFLDEEKKHDLIKLVTVAIKEPEKSSDDNSLLYVETSKEISKNKILSSLKESGLNGKILKSVGLSQVDGMIFSLVELDGFYLENDEAIKNFSKSPAKPYIKILGHYAKPIQIAG